MNEKLPKVYDEVDVWVRGRIIEVGPEICMVDLIELFQQMRTDKPIRIAVPTDALMGRKLKKEKLPPEIPM